MYDKTAFFNSSIWGYFVGVNKYFEFISKNLEFSVTLFSSLITNFNNIFVSIFLEIK